LCIPADSLFSPPKFALFLRPVDESRPVGWRPSLRLLETTDYTAAGNGDFDIVRILVGNGTEVDAKNKIGATALEMAEENGTQ